MAHAVTDVTCFSPVFCAVCWSSVFWSNARHAGCCRNICLHLSPATHTHNATAALKSPLETMKWRFTI